MPDETNEIEQEVTSAEGSDSQTADAGDNEGVVADSPTVERDEPGPVPYSRFKEVNERARVAEAALAARVADQWQNFQAAKQAPPEPQAPLFDEDTDRRLEQYIQRRMGPNQQMTQAEIAQVRAELNEIKVAKSNRDWDDLKPTVLSAYDRLRQSGFSGPVMVQALIDAERYRSGKPVREAVEQARRREETKAKVAGPSGTAGHDSEKLDWDDPKLDINEAIERVKSGHWGK